MCWQRYATDKIEESTEFVVTATQVRPLNYEFHQTGSKNKNMHIKFDWNARVAKNIADSPWGSGVAG
ncbi:MAG: hypothetical protein R3E08_04405 [Thiotrichaceae bacterium]